MVVNSQLQIKGILSLIMHQTQVGIPDRIFEIHLDEFLPYPDYYSILEMLQVRKVIRIKREPEDRESVMLESELDSLLSSTIQWKLSYAISTDKNFASYCAEIFGETYKNKVNLDANDLNLTYSSYIAKKGVLVLTPFVNLNIAEQGASSGKLRIDTRQCLLMKELFKNEDVLISGLTVHYLEKQKVGENLKINSVKNYKNVQTAINNKFQSVSGLKKLIVFKNNTLKINPLYLLKT